MPAIRSFSRSTSTRIRTWFRSAMASTTSRSERISAEISRTAFSAWPARPMKCSTLCSSPRMRPPRKMQASTRAFAPRLALHFNQAPQAQLESNVRHWRNLEVGAYFQDDWKVNKRLTLNLGLRYDLFTRHHEEDNLATTFLLGPGSDIVAGIENANSPANCLTPSQVALAQLAGVCGPGGFAPAEGLGKGDHNNIGPRVGFAYDVFGDGKTSLRGGFGLSYEGTLYNPLSNSRWNLPYYSFNFADNFLNGDVNTVIYGPTTCNATSCSPDPTATPTYTGAPTNPGQGIGAQATGNLTGWAPLTPTSPSLLASCFRKESGIPTSTTIS